jgi:nitrogen-specific signal transduction histidine kinase
MDELLKLMHDTMSPVAAIKGAAELLKTNEMSPEDTAKLLDIITVKSDHLNAILDAYYLAQRAKK